MLQQKSFLVGGPDDADHNYYTLELIVTEQSAEPKKNTSVVDFCLRLHSSKRAFEMHGIEATVTLKSGVYEHTTLKEYVTGEHSLGYYDSLDVLKDTVEVEHGEGDVLTISCYLGTTDHWYVPGKMYLNATMTLTNLLQGIGHVFTGGAWSQRQPYVGTAGAQAYIRIDGQWIKAGG